MGIVFIQDKMYKLTFTRLTSFPFSVLAKEHLVTTAWMFSVSSHLCVCARVWAHMHLWFTYFNICTGFSHVHLWLSSVFLCGCMNMFSATH